MSLSKWKKLSQTEVHRNPWWIYRRDEFRLPNGKQSEYHYVHTNGSSLVVPVLNDGRIVLVNQYRYLLDRESLELPCGGIKEGRTYEQTAAQELEEEAGFAARNWTMAGEFNPFNGATDEICRVFIAKNLSPVEAKPDETEEFEQIILRPEELDARIISGVVWDGMTIAGWTIAKIYL